MKQLPPAISSPRFRLKALLAPPFLATALAAGGPAVIKALGRLLLLLVAAVSAGAAALPPLDRQLGPARAIVRGSQLEVTTGAFTRRWELTPHGLRTVAVVFDGNTTAAGAATPACDWSYPGWLDAPAELVNLTAGESDDAGFTSKHLRVVAEFNYPAARTNLRYEIWAYPGADGLRTQLWVKGEGVEQKAPDAPTFAVLAGLVAGKTLSHEREIAFRVENLHPARQYTIELSAYSGESRVESVLLTSLDAESQLKVTDNFVVGTDPAAPAVVTAELGTNLRPDGSVTVRVRRADPAGPGPVLTGVRVREGGRVVAEFAGDPASAATTARPGTGQVEYLPGIGGGLRAIGYYNDTQHRHEPDKHLLREEAVEPGSIDWASVLCREATHGGIALAKESHKCVNQPGVDTGAFVAGAGGIAVTGWGVGRADLRADEWRWAWATWMVGYALPVGPPRAGRLAPVSLADARELGLKQFERVRYPVRADLDLYSKANTWGSGLDGAASMARAAETEVLAEIDSVAELGLDQLQIDDGWQTGRMPGRQAPEREWVVRPDWYPQGWKNVVDRAREKRVALGIWHAARAPLAALKHNYDTGHFVGWKLDFANLGQYDGAWSYLAKGRDFVAYTGHRVRVNWDVTENAPRFGYFWAGECGNVWLANRKPQQPANVVPRPWLMLRELWEISRYLNLNKFELPVQNFAMVNRELSDAHLHSDTYATALGLGGIPVFFQTTRLLTPAQRTETKALLEVYKRVRGELFASYILPIGDEPSNAGWSGLQWVRPDSGEFYLLVFRERLNAEPNRTLTLRWLAPGTALELENLRTGEKSSRTTGTDSRLNLSIESPGDILFLKVRCRRE